MDQEGEFRLAWAGARHGSDEAVAIIYRKLYGPLARLIKRHLDPNLRVVYDEEEAAQSTFRTVIRRLKEGKLDGYRFDRWKDLLNLLTRIAKCKCINKLSSLRTVRRGGGRVQSIDQTDIAAELVSPDGEPDLPLRERESWDDATSVFTEKERAALRMMSERYSLDEIWQSLGMSCRTLTRLRRDFRHQLRNMMDSDHQSAESERSGEGPGVPAHVIPPEPPEEDLSRRCA